MAQSTTNLGKIHVFPSETLYNQFKNLVADNDLALLKDDGAYIVAANLAQNGYVKFSNGLILQWGYYEAGQNTYTLTFPISFSQRALSMCLSNSSNGKGKAVIWELGKESASIGNDTWENYWIAVGV